MITITKIGRSVKIDTGNWTKYSDIANPSRDIVYDESVNKLDIKIGGWSSGLINLSDITIANVIPTNQTEFETQLALVFPETDGGSGGSADETLQEVTDNGNVTTNSIELPFIYLVREDGSKIKVMPHPTDETVQYLEIAAP